MRCKPMYLPTCDSCCDSCTVWVYSYSSCLCLWGAGSMGARAGVCAWECVHAMQSYVLLNALPEYQQARLHGSWF